MVIRRFYSRCCYSGLIIYSASHPAVPLTLDVCFYRCVSFRHIFCSCQISAELTICFRPPVQASLRCSTVPVKFSVGVLFTTLWGVSWMSQKSGRKRTREIPLILSKLVIKSKCFLVRCLVPGWTVSFLQKVLILHGTDPSKLSSEVQLHATSLYPHVETSHKKSLMETTKLNFFIHVKTFLHCLEVELMRQPGNGNKFTE